MKRASWVADLVVVAALVVGALFLAFMRPFWVNGATACGAAASTAAAAASALAWIRYRSSRDPHALFLATGLAAVAIQTGFGVVWYLRHGNLSNGATDFGEIPTALSTVVLHAWEIGWFIASVCFVFALPLRERRGRAPISSYFVIGTASMALIVADAMLVLIRPEISFVDLGTFPALRTGFTGLEVARPAVWIFAIGSSLLLSVAAVRELRAEGTLHLWLTAAFTLAAPAQIGVLFHGTLGVEHFLSWAEILTTVAVALVFVGLLRDVRRESSFMRRATDRAEEVLGGRAEIASMVSHEIRGPVTTIRGLASTGDRHWDRLPEAERREFLRLIVQESERLLHIADETSMALKVDARTLVYVRRPADLADVVREAVEKASTGNHPVTEDLEPGISFPLDRARFAEAITQLVENAAKFSPEATPIEVRTHADGGEVVLEVVDHGPGIPPDRREAAFGKFPGFRPPGYEEVPGTGLGLFICRAHVREHGGDVVATEASDGGTMLRITLPNQGEEEHGR